MLIGYSTCLRQPGNLHKGGLVYVEVYKIINFYYSIHSFLLILTTLHNCTIAYLWFMTSQEQSYVSFLQILLLCLAAM